MTVDKDTTSPLGGRLTIREAQRRDVGIISDLWREMMDYHGEHDSRFRFVSNVRREVERHILETIRSRGSRVYVAEVDGSIVGYILGEIHIRKPIYPIGKYGFVSDISVNAEWRRSGIGRVLVETLLAWFRKEGVTAVELFILEANPVSTAFWQSMGFGHYLRLLRLDMT